MLIFTIVNLLIQKKQYKGKEASVGLNKSYLWMLLIFYILPKLMMNLMLVGVCFAATFANIIPKERVDKILEYINEIIAVIIAKQGFKLAGELDGGKELKVNSESPIEIS